MSDDETPRERALRKAHEKRMRKHLNGNSRYAQRDGDEMEDERKRHVFQRRVRAEAKAAKRSGELTAEQIHLLRAYGLI